MWHRWWEIAGGRDWSDGPGCELLCVSRHTTSSLCTFPEGLNTDDKSQRVLWAEGTAYAKALR